MAPRMLSPDFSGANRFNPAAVGSSMLIEILSA
jgi:hypothetical protein